MDFTGLVHQERIHAAPALWVSAITGFEIGIKCRGGKLTLPASRIVWLETVRTHHGISAVPLDLEVCALATELAQVHRDPCDRMIIATAMKNRWPVVTPDPQFRRYGAEVIWQVRWDS